MQTNIQIPDKLNLEFICCRSISNQYVLTHIVLPMAERIGGRSLAIHAIAEIYNEIVYRFMLQTKAPICVQMLFAEYGLGLLTVILGNQGQAEKVLKDLLHHHQVRLNMYMCRLTTHH